jgi:hypothetical protein
MNRIAPVLILAVLANLGCSKRQDPVGLADWPAVIRVTEDMLTRGDTTPLISHTDMSGMPSDSKKRLEKVLRNWQAIPKPFKLDSVDIVDPKDFKYHEGMSERMAKAFGTPKWSRPPEKMIVYRYSGPDGASQRWYFGVFQDHGKWYFSACYPE